jgi:hypothetical protein
MPSLLALHHRLDTNRQRIFAHTTKRPSEEQCKLCTVSSSRNNSRVVHGFLVAEYVHIVFSEMCVYLLDEIFDSNGCFVGVVDG